MAITQAQLAANARTRQFELKRVMDKLRHIETKHREYDNVDFAEVVMEAEAELEAVLAALRSDRLAFVND